VYETLFKFVQIWHFYCTMSNGSVFTGHSVKTVILTDSSVQHISTR